MIAQLLLLKFIIKNKLTFLKNQVEIKHNSVWGYAFLYYYKLKFLNNINPCKNH